ncbi:ATPase domain-containing protein [Undibacterium sp.]|uniref:ATPase domain-containing protein n=1 Tax=Undibacterium sp. TaxID=1914977 RepID=UPI002730D167|nr:ATPase domain-containing protein [Undibacterium sp.]MDP1979477.1 ATPase domain-containing protein [Undibacterium sp.]
MESSELPRHQVIVNNVIQRTEQGADRVILLWEKSAEKIIPIVGESGFESLYERSVCLSQATFPWLAPDSLSTQNDHRFAELKMCFEGQTRAQASAANALLLITFADLLAWLIGEQLTADILNSAWSTDETDRIDKELKMNEKVTSERQETADLIDNALKMNGKVTIRRLKTGVSGLDNLLGGGLPEFSFNLIAGAPGSGKTTLAHQIMFSLASQNNRALFFTVLGEPTLKMLRHQQQFPFFETSKLKDSIRYVNLSEDLGDGDFDRVLLRITKEVKSYAPSLVFVDSFRSIAHSAKDTGHGESEIQRFVQQLGIQMTSWQATTFLIGEYLIPESESSPVFTIADGILWLTQNLLRNSLVRKIQVVKIRGQSQAPGLHTFRISKEGIEIYPRAIVNAGAEAESTVKVAVEEERVPMGIAGLDDMLGGGLPPGYSLLVVGPSGSGKTILATQFLAEGARRGEKGVIAAFEKSPSQLLSNQVNALVKANQVGVIETRALDLSIDQTLHDLIDMITRMKATRVVIDSLSGFELALAPEFQEDFRASLYRMVAELNGMGVTILMTSELEDRYTDLRFSPFGSAFLADAIIVHRYIEIDGEFKRAMSVVKVRGSQHSKQIRLFDISDEGIILGAPLSAYAGIMTGRPRIAPGLE